ncbi:unnamed protein product [Macrosiphum euphorbiae]|uniref:Uncharacterized protein n=1 Tax=Macrosiphum euphorbiae TaxID=13131 RepID=A0AAV0W312_9HEMI|nr:unnamed protein product [Macrosiphum euphorbiae]
MSILLLDRPTTDNATTATRHHRQTMQMQSVLCWPMSSSLHKPCIPCDQVVGQTDRHLPGKWRRLALTSFASFCFIVRISFREGKNIFISSGDVTIVVRVPYFFSSPYDTSRAHRPLLVYFGSYRV